MTFSILPDTQSCAAEPSDKGNHDRCVSREQPTPGLGFDGVGFSENRPPQSCTLTRSNLRSQRRGLPRGEVTSPLWYREVLLEGC